MNDGLKRISEFLGSMNLQHEEYSSARRTQFSSLYATQVMQNLDGIWQQDYQQDQYLNPLSTSQIFELVDSTLSGLMDEMTWMRSIRHLRARLMLRWIWQDCNQLIDVMTLTDRKSVV